MLFLLIKQIGGKLPLVGYYSIRSIGRYAPKSGSSPSLAFIFCRIIHKMLLNNVTGDLEDNVEIIFLFISST